ncbi:MAG: hypothetical protein WCF23_22685 [Candidatus Nitrosopolaris sp.]
MYEPNSSELRKLKVSRYVKDNPGISKEGVVKGMKGDPSRITVLNALNQLEEEGWIIARKDKPNSQIYKLYSNEKNILVSLDQELDDLEKAFTQLSCKSNEIFEADKKSVKSDLFKERIRLLRLEYKRYNRTEKELKKIYSILDYYNQVIIEPYPNPNMAEPELVPIPDDVQKAFFDSFDLLKSCFQRVSGFEGAFSIDLVWWAFGSMQAVYNKRNTDIWPLLIQDEQTLTKLYAAVYTRISKIQLLFSKFFGQTRSTESARAGAFVMPRHSEESFQHNETILTSAIYTQLGMKKEVEAIAKCICKVHHDLFKHGRPSSEFIEWKVLLRNLKMYDNMMSSPNVR